PLYSRPRPRYPECFMSPRVEEPRYPIPFYSEGWFQIAWSHELRSGQIKAVKQFGKNYVLFRTESGELCLLDDVCPHLGAHLSEGGEVRGESIRCPYHGWQFAGDGRCSKIPYSE